MGGPGGRAGDGAAVSDESERARELLAAATLIFEHARTIMELRAELDQLHKRAGELELENCNALGELDVLRPSMAVIEAERDQLRERVALLAQYAQHLEVAEAGRSLTKTSYCPADPRRTIGRGPCTCGRDSALRGTP